jgi:hypothetical protein
VFGGGGWFGFRDQVLRGRAGDDDAAVPHDAVADLVAGLQHAQDLAFGHARSAGSTATASCRAGSNGSPSRRSPAGRAVRARLQQHARHAHAFDQRLRIAAAGVERAERHAEGVEAGSSSCVMPFEHAALLPSSISCAGDGACWRRRRAGAAAAARAGRARRAGVRVPARGSGSPRSAPSAPVGGSGRLRGMGLSLVPVSFTVGCCPSGHEKMSFTFSKMVFLPCFLPFLPSSSSNLRSSSSCSEVIFFGTSTWTCTTRLPRP